MKNITCMDVLGYAGGFTPEAIDRCIRNHSAVWGEPDGGYYTYEYNSEGYMSVLVTDTDLTQYGEDTYPLVNDILCCLSDVDEMEFKLGRTDLAPIITTMEGFGHDDIQLTFLGYLAGSNSEIMGGGTGYYVEIDEDDVQEDWMGNRV